MAIQLQEDEIGYYIEYSLEDYGIGDIGTHIITVEPLNMDDEPATTQYNYLLHENNEDLTDEDVTYLTYPLKHYHSEYWRSVTDYEYAIRHRTLVDEGIWMYNVPSQKIYLNSLGYAVEYDKQHIIEGEVYYEFDETIDSDAGTYIYLNNLEWKKIREDEEV